MTTMIGMSDVIDEKELRKMYGKKQQKKSDRSLLSHWDTLKSGTKRTGESYTRSALVRINQIARKLGECLQNDKARQNSQTFQVLRHEVQTKASVL